MERVEEGVGLLGFLGQIEVDDEAGPVLARELGKAELQLGAHLVEHLAHVALERDVARVLLVAQIEHYVHQRHGVIVDGGDYLTVVLFIYGVGGVEQARGLDVLVGELGKLPGRERACDGVAVHGLYVGETHGALDLGQGLYGLEELGLLLIASGGYEHGDKVVRPEGGAHHLVGYLALVLLYRVQGAVSVDIGAAVCEHESRRRNYQKERRYYVSGFYRQPAPERDLGHKAAVMGLVNELGEEHQQSRHEQEDGEHAHDYGLYEHDAHVVAEAEVHERQRRETRDGREAGRAYLGDGLGERGNGGITRLKVLALLCVAVAEDDGVVYG